MIDPRSILNDWLSSKKIDLIESYKNNRFKASGNFATSLRVETDAKGGRMFGIYYAYWMENARSQNKKQDEESIRKWCLWASSRKTEKYEEGFLITWARDKGIFFDNYYGLAYHIATKGYSLSDKRSRFISKVFNHESIMELNRLITNKLRIDIKSDIMFKFK